MELYKSDRKIQCNIPLKDKTWFQTGGPAKRYTKPSSLKEFQDATWYANNNNLKKYSYQDVYTHNNKSNNIWIIHKEYIYDITDFIDSHPGGKDKIMLAEELVLILFGKYIHNI